MSTFEVKQDNDEEICVVTLKDGTKLELFTDDEGLNILSLAGVIAATTSCYQNEGLLVFKR
jgi:hypothetical protein